MTKVGAYDQLGPLSIPMDFDFLAELIVRENYGVHRMLSALVRAREQPREGQPDRLMREIQRMLDEGAF